MKRWVGPALAASILGIGLVLPPGCTSAAWQQAADNPVGTFTAFSERILNWLGLAAQLFATIKSALPAEQQDAAQRTFDQAMVDARTALAALHDGADAVAQAQSGAPDLGKLTSDVLDAVKKIRAIVDDVRSKAKPSAAQGAPIGYDRWVTMQASLERKR